MTKELLENYVRNFGGNNMNKDYYWIQVNDYMEPFKIALTEEEVNGVKKVLVKLAQVDEDALVQMTDEDGDIIFVDNYKKWIKTHR